MYVYVYDSEADVVTTRDDVTTVTAAVTDTVTEFVCVCVCVCVFVCLL